MSAGDHRSAVQNDSGDRVTVGSVQREIKVGMSSAQVAEVLGSPNIVTTDEERREVWIYDKFSSDVAVSENSGYGTLILLGMSGSSGARSTTQRTLTVIIKFDKDKKVRDFSYRTSRF
ncbi:outer membrane protein assembly factor BamE [Candidatus Nitronereus thalassa]|uniref:Outer membrane protein assembly factor BamE n=2 Tax=Candidatus Nitronereus thalassa TaxID=3020898 RepID=A0ABU3K894_9BACT|nr:outer membrane protein assembly factor BamE [Candidatus Nitronereus thalassa]